MAELSKSLGQPHADSLEMLTAAVVQSIDGVDVAAVSIRRGNVLETLAATSQLAVDADRLQTETQEGPCFDAAAEGAMFVSENLLEDPRWPRYGPKAAEIGIAAQMGVDLHPPDGTRAALNLYAYTPHAFSGVIDLAEFFGSHASLLLGYTASMTQMETAMRSRQVVGQAVGIVMERYSIDEDRAFNFLVRTSRDSNVKLREIAADIVAGVNRRNSA